MSDIHPTTEGISFQPRAVSDMDLAFGGIDCLMPPKEAIPRDLYRFGNGNWGSRLFNDMFYAGLTKLEIQAKPGVDREKALRHIKTIMRSFEPKPERQTCSGQYS